MRVEPDTCPHCGYEADCVGHMNGEDKRPDPGDVTLCISCAGVSVFDGPDLRMRKLTSQEWQRTPVATRRQINHIQAAIRRMNRAN